MKVTLISHTGQGMGPWAAADLLIFTKSTRLNLNPGLMDEIRGWSQQRKMEELAYMANTIPSSWEFVDYTFLVEGVSRAYTHQQVRTRAASYAQQTMRVLDVGEYDYIYTDRVKQNEAAMHIIDDVNHDIQEGYRRLRDMGLPVEDCRGILPTNIATNIICKFNMRTFVELSRSRSGGRTQGEYQKVVAQMIGAVLDVHPWMQPFLFPKGRDHFDDIEEFAEEQFGGDLLAKGKLLKIVDKMRKGVS